MKIKLLLVKSAALLAAVVFISPASAQKAPEQAPPAAGSAQSDKKPVAPRAPKKIAKKKIAEADKNIPPSLEERLEEHRLAVRRGEDREQTAAYLIDEITVTGTYKSVE